MTDFSTTSSAVMLWHDWAPTLALAMLGVVFLFAVMQFAVAGSGGRAARFLNGGSLRVGIIVGLVLTGTVPAAALGLILSERSATQRQETMTDLLEDTAGSIARVVDSFVDKHVAGIATAAKSISAAGRFDTATLTQALLTYHDAYSDFLTMLSANQQGTIVAATSNMTGFLTPVENPAGNDVSDRPYFIRAMQDGETYISRVFKGRGLGSDPIVAISAPLRDFDGAPVGIVEGSLDLRAFSRADSFRPKLDGAVMIIVDQDDRVIYASTAAALDELEAIGADPLLLASRGVMGGSSYEFVSGGAGAASSHIGVYVGTKTGWRVYMRMPTSAIRQQMQSDYLLGALLLVLACVVSLLVAGSVVRRVSRSVGDMNHAIKRFSVDGGGENIRVPRNTPREFVPIFKQMRRRSRQLEAAYQRLRHSMDAGDKLRRELTQAISVKEVEIAERTSELEEANARLSGLSKTDGLTGLANRREFESFEQRVWRDAARDRCPFSIVMLDVDFFKIYNDRLGHQAGDDCLRQVAEAIRGCAARPLDLVARYGGEEFIAVLGNTGIAGALRVAERMRQAVRHLALPHPGSSHDVVTVSVGVASLIPEADGDCSQLIKTADEALYYAKAAGRNCVVSRDGDAFVTCEPDRVDTAATNVLEILTGGKLARAGSAGKD